MTIFRYLILAFMFGTSAAAATIMRLERAFPPEYGLELIAIHANRVLVKPDSGVALNTDFVLRFTSSSGDELECGIAGTLFGFAASESLSTAAIEWIGSEKRLSIVALLDTAQVSERLVIGLPECLRPLAYALSPTLVADSGSYEFLYYNSAQEAEIERKLGRWDIYIAPETEFAADSAIPLVDNLIGEWHLLIDEDEDDLAATAVNYCVKGILGDARTGEESSLIHHNDIVERYPYNFEYALGLFADLKGKEKIGKLYFPAADQLPTTAAKLAKEISECQKLAPRYVPAQQAQGMIYFELVPTRSATGLAGVSWRLAALAEEGGHSARVDIADVPVLAAADSRGINWRRAVEECVDGRSIDVGCDSLLSQSLSERCRIIPLGRTRLVAKLGIHARCLQLPGRPAMLRHFYSKVR